MVYRIQQKLGRTFVQLEPYALYPLDEYFGGKITKDRTPSLQFEMLPANPAQQWNNVSLPKTA
ncbi:MAG TPA: hypothetical protein VG675_18470 [Bryobacteraceae bacterium]|nr:hypothetical protein [Bryobacteraceae bacterium]